LALFNRYAAKALGTPEIQRKYGLCRDPDKTLLDWWLPLNDKPRVCAVSYLNTVPLVWGMRYGKQRDLFDLSFSIPAECADRLADGRADIGIVPAIELTRQKLEIIRGAGIACRGPVRSILLISKYPPAQIRTLAADSSSRTSVQLARVILTRKFGAEPAVLPHAPDLPRMLDVADACLIIGDPALWIDPRNLPFYVLDLGMEWTEMTDLPMVFAVWAARAEFPAREPQPFLDSLAFGLAHLDEIVEKEHARHRVSAELAREYLTRHIAFDLGESEYAGLSLFLRYASDLPMPDSNPKDVTEVRV
jgi:predicted solute-binding protein